MDELDRGVVLQAPPQPPLLSVPAQVVSVGVAAAERGERGTRVERGFTTAARMVTATSTATTTPQATIMSRTPASKRKLEELEIDIAETWGSANLQVRARLEAAAEAQREIFSGRQLQDDQTLESCNVDDDAILSLVATMRSTAFPGSWQLMNVLVATIGRMCAVEDSETAHGVKLVHAQDTVRTSVIKFLNMSTFVPESEHMHVFQLTGATSALVMLLLSKVESNRKCAEESITYFLWAVHEYLPAHIHCNCASVLLDFCKLLSKSAPDHSLYSLCCLGLKYLLDDIAHRSPYFYEAEADSIVHDFPPFVNELSKNNGLLLSLKFVDVPLLSRNDPSPGSQGTASSAFGMAVKIGLQGGLCTLFLELLEEIEKCLKTVEEDEKFVERPGTIRPLFFVLLKGLHSIAKLHDGAMDYLLDVLRRRSISLNMLIRQSRLQDDDSDARPGYDFWLLEFRNLLDFETKRKLVTAMLPDPADDHEFGHEVKVHRSQLLTESFDLLAYEEPDTLQAGIFVKFETEEATGPGVLREWFSMICREIFNCQNATDRRMFLPCPKDQRRFFPNPASGVNPGDLIYFRFCGRVIALALMHRVQVDVVFAVAFFKQLAGLPISWEDTKDADPVLYESCKKILEMDGDTINSDALGLTFVTEVEELGTRKTLELCQGGREMVVNSENRRQYVDLMVHRLLVVSVAEQIKSFSEGLSDLLVDVTHQQLLCGLDPEDLDLLLYGKDRNICLDDWKLHTEYHEYTVTDDQITWFWQVVEAMTPEQRRRVLFFSTSVTHLPAEGFAGLSSKFHIHRSHTDTSWLPTAHTCFNYLVLPPYPTFDMMRTRLHSIAQTHIAEGFGFA